MKHLANMEKCSKKKSVQTCRSNCFIVIHKLSPSSKCLIACHNHRSGFIPYVYQLEENMGFLCVQRFISDFINKKNIRFCKPLQFSGKSVLLFRRNYSAPKIPGIMQEFQQRQVLQLQKRLSHVFLLSRYKNGF